MLAKHFHGIFSIMITYNLNDYCIAIEAKYFFYFASVL